MLRTRIAKNTYLTLMMTLCLLLIGADVAQAARIKAVSGIREGQNVQGEVYIETKVAGDNDNADYQVRYEVEGPSGFVMTATRAPYVLGGRRNGWDTGDADSGSYQLKAYLIRDGRVIDFRYINFTIASNLKVSRIIGINRDITLTQPTTVEARVRGGKPSKVVFDIKGPVNIKHTDYNRPYYLQGDKQKWDVHGVPAGDYTISVTAYDGNTPAHTRTLPFRVEQDIRIQRVTGVSHGDVLTEPVRVAAEVTGGTPSKVVFKVTGPKEVFDVEQQAPYVMFGDGQKWDVTQFPPGRYTLRVHAFSGNERTHSRRMAFTIADKSNPKPTPAPDPTPNNPTPDPDDNVKPTPRSRNFLGMNLAEVNYYDREWVFVDAMKMAREWLPTRPGGSDPWNTGENLKLNDQGWPILKNNQAAHTIMFRDTDGAYPAGRYVCTYDGDGDVVLDFDAKMVHQTKGRVVADVTPTNLGIYLRIDRSNPNNPVRNVKVWLPGFEDAKSPFHPFFLKRLKPFSVIRFMDWMRTNGSDISSWSDRPRYDYYTQGTDQGVALEYMIDLCNELGADPWFCMPHEANDRYVENFAKLVKKRLRPDLNVYVEWSNEVWNSQFPQHDYIKDRSDGRSLSGSFNAAWADEADRDFEIWEDVFGNQRNRVIRVAAGQKDNPWVTEQLVNELDGEFDAISCSTYFGLTRAQLNQLTSSVTARQLLDQALNEMSRSLRSNYQAHGKLSRQWTRKLGRNIPLIGYEGGQHYTNEGRNPPYGRAFLAMQDHPKMYDAYLANMREWDNAGGSLFTAFNFVEKPDQWGAWGALDVMDQAISTAPKYRALLDYKAK